MNPEDECTLPRIPSPCPIDSTEVGIRNAFPENIFFKMCNLVVTRVLSAYSNDFCEEVGRLISSRLGVVGGGARLN